MAEIETKTGVNFPSYKTIQNRYNYDDFISANYTIDYTIEIDPEENKNLIQQIEAKINDKSSIKTDVYGRTTRSWKKINRGEYEFNDFDADENTRLRLHYFSKESKIEILYGGGRKSKIRAIVH